MTCCCFTIFSVTDYCSEAGGSSASILFKYLQNLTHVLNKGGHGVKSPVDLFNAGLG
jgi:hypothetical protein